MKRRGYPLVFKGVSTGVPPVSVNKVPPGFRQKSGVLIRYPLGFQILKFLVLIRYPLGGSLRGGVFIYNTPVVVMHRSVPDNQVLRHPKLKI